ncbi:response regulator [Chitinophaga sp. XS-30]|nr:response regulator [Chitinophaga sp. XS-30]
MIRPSLAVQTFAAFCRRQVYFLVNAGVVPGDSLRNKRTRIINISSLIAASLVFFFGGGLTIFSGRTAILYPAVPETAMFVSVIWLNHQRKYFYAALIWHLTFCMATLIFGIMLRTVIDATHMAGYLIGAPLLIFKKSETRLLMACIACSVTALVGIELNTHLHFFPPLEISSSLYPVFRVATWTTVIGLNVVVLLFYLQLNNMLMDRSAKANAKLRRLNKKLAKASAYKTVYVNETTHELRAPLNALYAISQLLDDESIKGEDLRKMHSSIGHSVNLSLEIINNVLELAKIETGRILPPKIERMQVRGWLEDISHMFSYQASFKQITFELNVEAQVPDEINFARVQVTQIVNNLISNAVKFSKECSAIRIAVGCNKQDWWIAISDNGIGMDQSTLDKVFIPFYSSGTGNPQGTGLGMHIAKKLTERLGGGLTAESELGQGSRFTARFPLEAAAAVPATALPNVPSLPHPVKVLIIDDDSIGNRYYARVLSKMGCTVVIAETGKTGLESAVGNPPDLILMDMSLPDTNGKALLQSFQQHPVLNNIPVVFVTGSFLNADQQKAMELGAKAYVVKPLRVDTISHILEKYGR